MVANLWLTIDPGEETGFAIWRGRELLLGNQAPLWQFIDGLDEWLQTGKQPGAWLFEYPNSQLGAIVCEDWAIYPWAAEGLTWDKCRTARGIGAIELLARQHNIPLTLQPASIKDGAKAAGAEELFLTPLHPNRHANDAIMHGAFYLAKEGKAPC